jgi:mannose-6-phosphate isomerase-like protein (cupin superfamily)
MPCRSASCGHACERRRSKLVEARADRRLGARLRCIGAEIKFLCGGARTEHAWSLAECSAPPDVGPPPHHHAWDEAYFVLEGELAFVIGERETRVTAGGFVFIPGGTVHGFRGCGPGVARVLIFDAPAASEPFFRDTAGEVRELPRDLAKMPEIGARHGLHFLPPPA